MAAPEPTIVATCSRDERVALASATKSHWRRAAALAQRVRPPYCFVWQARTHGYCTLTLCVPPSHQHMQGLRSISILEALWAIVGGILYLPFAVLRWCLESPPHLRNDRSCFVAEAAGKRKVSAPLRVISHPPPPYPPPPPPPPQTPRRPTRACRCAMPASRS